MVDAHDYQRLTKQIRDKTLPLLSKKNKEYLIEFEMQHDVKPATKECFWTGIHYFFKTNKDNKDIKKDMFDKSIMNKSFFKLREAYGHGTYNTSVKAIRQLCIWLNEDGIKPKGLRDIKTITWKRDIAPSDMVNWDDVEKMVEATPSVQMRAIIPTQVDAGLRPSEFYDLNYGDIKRKEDMLIVNVNDTHKTGRRAVPIYRATPYLLRWLDEHPTKKDTDPLWIKERKDGAIEKYKMHSIQQRVKKLALAVGIKKPVDWYALRHSSCTLSKKDNVPIDLACEKFGHSAKFYSQTYGRLDDEETAKRMQKHMELKEGLDGEQLIVKCFRCKETNEKNRKNCVRCGSILNVADAMVETEKRDNRIKELEEKYEKLANAVMKKALKEKKN